MRIICIDVKACSPLHTETYRISLFPEHSSGTNDFDTKENTTVRYDTIEVGNSFRDRIGCSLSLLHFHKG